LSNKLYKIELKKMDTGFLIALITFLGGGFLLLPNKTKK